MLLHDVGKAGTRSVDAEGTVHFYEHEPLSSQMSDEILRRLRFSNAEIDIVVRTVQCHLRPAQWARDEQVSNRAAYRFFRDTGDAGIDTCVLALADWRGKSAPQIDLQRDAQQRAANAMLLDRYFRAPDQVIAPPALVDGHTLIKELQSKPGPQIGQLLEAIREAQAAGEVKTREEAIAFAKKNMMEDGRRWTEES
jgi:tRNA nucleotidyltransferase/poly(A) polymerase